MSDRSNPPTGREAADAFGRPVAPSATDAFGNPLRSTSSARTRPVPVVLDGERGSSVPTLSSAPSSAAGGTVAPPSSATWALLLGIGGFLIFPFVLSVAAWIVGARARRECEQLPGRPGHGMATTGWVLGILGVIGWILIGLLGVLALLVLIGSSEIAYD